MLWADAIADLDFEFTVQAAKQWVREEKWPPSVAELRALSKRLMPDYQSRALQLCPPWEPRPDPSPEQMAVNRERARNLIEALVSKQEPDEEVLESTDTE